jgi:4-amino-4-deoxy-L-arabinose transferase-like glycosyltransferase
MDAASRSGGRAALLGGLLLVVLTAPIFLYRLGRPGLGDPDEGRNAEVAREMLETGDWVTPRINGARYLDKPPAFFWILAVSYRLFGVNEFAARLPSVLAALSGIALVFWFARRHFGPAAGWLAGAVLALSPLYMVFGRIVIFDMALCVCMTGSVLAAFEAMEGEGRLARVAGAAFFAAAGVGTIVKGPVALAVPFLVALAWALLTRRPRRLGRLGWMSGLLIYAAIVAPWLWLASARNPGYLEYATIGENLDRMTSNRFQTSRPFWFYLKIILPGLFPWIVFCLAAAARRVRGLRQRLAAALNEAGAEGRGSRAAVYCAVWLAVLLLFFSAISSKRPSYMLPCAVPVALLSGALWASALAGRRQEARDDMAAGAVWVAVICGLAAVAVAAAGPGGQVRGISGGQYDRLLSRGLLFGLSACGLLASAALLMTAWRGRRPLLAFVSSALVIAVMVPLARAGIGYIESDRSSRPVSTFLAGRLRPGDRLICFDQYRPGLNFYLRRPIDLVIDISGPGVLFSSNYIKQHLQEYLRDPTFRWMSEASLRATLARDGARVFVLAPRKRYADLQAQAGVPLRAIYEDAVGGVFVRAEAGKTD